MKNDEFDVANFGISEIAENKFNVIYSGVEGSKDCFANTVEVLGSNDGYLLRFYHQRPLRRQPLEIKHGADHATSALVGAPDTLELALQCSVLLPKASAVHLWRQLAALLDTQESAVKQDDDPK